MHFGLIGKSLKHSFSQKYFEEKFLREGLNYTYHNYELEDISEFEALIKQNPQLKGLNVTIPYKESVITYLDEISEDAEKIGAVNTISITKNHLKGYNTDVFGFEKSLLPILKPHHTNALILGTGGASKAVAFVLEKLQISYKKVSRNNSGDFISYEDANQLLDQYYLVINTTPLGTYPNILEYPPISFHSVSENHLFYDLIYNPSESLFLKEAKRKGAQTKNGLEMLSHQADKAWYIWEAI